MIHVRFDPSELAGEDLELWTDWMKRAEAATDAIVQKWEQTGAIKADDFDPKIWSELKQWKLKTIFAGKCAYCETHIDRQPGHAEHFRPKAGVRNRTGASKKFTTATTTAPDGSTLDHPGYFWLAYNWKNLLPCCHACNSGRGKNNQFPTASGHAFLRSLPHKTMPNASLGWIIKSQKHPGHYYLEPEELDELEGQLLLHPYQDDPSKHLVFGYMGIAAPREIDGEPSKKGQHSIEAYDLGHDMLRRARQSAQEKAVMATLAVYSAAIAQSKSPLEARSAANGMLKTLLSDPAGCSYSAAVQDYVKVAVPWL